MGKFNVSNSVTVNAPIEDVFEKLTNPQMQLQWMSGDTVMRNYSPPPPLAVGTRWESVITFMGRELVSQVEVLELNRPYDYHFRVDGLISGVFQDRCEVVDDGVQVTSSFEGETSGFFANLAIPLITRQANQQIQGNMKSLKQFIES